MTSITGIAEAEALIHAHAGPPEKFLLPLSDTLQDPIGMNMAIITDSILARGWDPDGFIQKEGYRLYKYKRANP